MSAAAKRAEDGGGELQGIAHRGFNDILTILGSGFEGAARSAFNNAQTTILRNLDKLNRDLDWLAKGLRGAENEMARAASEGQAGIDKAVAAMPLADRMGGGARAV